eukprot:4616721-Pleurochrysis_carterae.AAC.3
MLRCGEVQPSGTLQAEGRGGIEGDEQNANLLHVRIRVRRLQHLTMRTCSPPSGSALGSESRRGGRGRNTTLDNSCRGLISPRGAGLRPVHVHCELDLRSDSRSMLIIGARGAVASGAACARTTSLAQPPGFC